MGNKFKIGDVVEVIKNYNAVENCGMSNYVGQVFTIIGQALMYNNATGRSAFVNIVDEPCPTPGSVIGFEDEYLRLVPGDDCYKKTEWDEAIFKPRILERVE